MVLCRPEFINGYASLRPAVSHYLIFYLLRYAQGKEGRAYGKDTRLAAGFLITFLSLGPVF